MSDELGWFSRRVRRWADRNPDKADRLADWIEKLLNLLGRKLEKLDNRLALWIEKWGPPEGDRRCPWHTAIGEHRCVRKIGHRGLCQTTRMYGPPDMWYGINFPKREYRH